MYHQNNREKKRAIQTRYEAKPETKEKKREYNKQREEKYKGEQQFCLICRCYGNLRQKARHEKSMKHQENLKKQEPEQDTQTESKNVKTIDA